MNVCHLEGHMRFSLDISNLNPRPGSDKHILDSVHLIDAHVTNISVWDILVN